MGTSRSSFLADLNAPAAWAGITAFVWYAFGAVPLHIGVSEQLGLSTAQTSCWIFIVWLTGAVSTVAASLYFRQPIPITWTIPGLVYLGTLAGRFSFEQLAAANLLAGVLLVVLGISGIGGRIMKWLPLPIVMGMFGGSILALTFGSGYGGAASFVQEGCGGKWVVTSDDVKRETGKRYWGPGPSQ